ncbi:hypothetical protein B0T17DRAFT_112854 [Bombardia bombarda]|uniref:Secreted protein n=1 Tax=Bombardia bombarda TaxID=252184 RepID=A0AA39TKD1_9PEZI|nr:hypothetical protein B0T17DRAFT_112854 [Bombardia bombarda]
MRLRRSSTELTFSLLLFAGPGIGWDVPPVTQRSLDIKLQQTWENRTRHRTSVHLYSSVRNSSLCYVKSSPN